MEFGFHRRRKFYFVKYNVPTFSTNRGWYKSNSQKRVAYNWIFYLPQSQRIIYLFGRAPPKVMTDRNVIRVQFGRCKENKSLEFKTPIRTSLICMLIKGDREGIFIRARVPLVKYS